MKTIKSIIVASLLLSSSLVAQELTSPEQIYIKKCAMCHSIDKGDLPKGESVAPPLNTAMKNVMIGIDLIEEPENVAKLNSRTIEYLKDYFFNPAQSKSYCEDVSFKKFGTMPSMKGFMTDQQLNVLVPWLVENHKITKDANDDYIDQHGDKIK